MKKRALLSGRRLDRRRLRRVFAWTSLSLRPRRAFRLLWAEDSDADQYLIRAAAEAFPDARLHFTVDGAGLLEALDAGDRPDLVVLDVNMPGMNGLEALRRLREGGRHRDVPVVMFSTGNEPDEVRSCLDLGAIDYVQKPVPHPQFVAAVHRILAHAADPPRSPVGPRTVPFIKG
jgi:CheY-like chemotaxis protein